MSIGRRPAGRSPAVWLLVVAAYLPALTAAPGRMPSDTKLYLYLDPGRLLADASLTWDVRQFAGWVPHQVIAYLWPSGPWFWVFETMGVPDWIAHRLWLGTVLLMGGLGVRWAARQLGLDGWGAGVAGLLYLLTPYVLPYVSRTSVMLLPWAGLGWLVGLTVTAATRSRWRDVGAFGLVVLTIGAVNATALALIAPAPLLWLIHAASARIISWRRAVATAVKLGAVSLAVSVWWIAMLLVQGRYGADLLRFSETLRDVSHTSVSLETWRVLGYWLFYVADPYAHTTTASIPYLTNPALIVLSFALPAACVAALAAVRWQHRRFAIWSIVVGLVLAIGVHPYEDPSPVMRPLVDSVVALALRSSTRALPLVVLGMALGAGAAVTALRPRSVRWRTIAAASVVVAAVANLPAAWTGGYVDPALVRDQDVPRAWTDAAAALDRGSSEYRVLQVPGAEFGAFRWGYTVDPPLPGLTTRPLVTRDLLPLGSPGAMDLLYAFDNRFQIGTIEPASIAPVARLLAADTIWVTGDQAFERFRTPRPELVADLFRQQPRGLGVSRPFGEPAVNVPTIEMVDEQSLSDDRIGEPVPPVELVEVLDPVPVIRTATRTVLLSGSGDGLVDAAAAGLIDGTEAVFYGADLLGEPELRRALLRDAADTAGVVVITDSNRRRAVHWRSSQDVLGMTESASPRGDLLRDDVADQRLEVFDTDDVATQTVASLVPDDASAEPFTVRASSYGEPFAYRPEHRASMAVDGDPTTAWLVGIRGDPVGEAIEIGPPPAQLMLLQSQDPAATRRISEVRLEQGGVSQDIELDERSWNPPGQPVALQSPGPDAVITILATEEREGGTDSGPSGVGFAEIGPRAAEVIHLPQELLGEVDPTTPLALVMQRERTRPTDRWRSDPEPALRRRFELPSERNVDLTVTLRLDRRSSDDVLDDVAGTQSPASADRHLTGVPAARGAAAADGDSTTAWVTPFGAAVGSVLRLEVAAGTRFDELELEQPAEGGYSPITSLRISAAGTTVEVEVAAPGATGRSRVELPSPLTSAGEVLLEISGIDARMVRDRRYGEWTSMPSAVAEVAVDGLIPVSTGPSASGCRDDLLRIDDAAVGLLVTEPDIDRLLNGEAVEVRTCSDTPLRLGPGTHEVVGSGGRDAASTHGIDVDRVVITSNLVTVSSASTGAPVEVQRSRTSRTLDVPACPTGCWLIVGEGFDPAWIASAGGESLGAPVRVSGGFNGWRLEPADTTRRITMEWPPQRGLDRALLVSAVAILGCILLVLGGRRHRNTVEATPPVWDLRGLPQTARSSIGAAAVLVVGTALLVGGGRWIIASACAAAVMIALRRPRWAGWATAVVVAGLGARVAVRQLRNDLPADARWVEGLDRWHALGVFAVVLLLASSFGADPVPDPVAGQVGSDPLLVDDPPTRQAHRSTDGPTTG